MHKKLTTILLAVLIILIGKVDAATLTQKVGAGFIQSTVDEGQEVTIKFVSSKYTFSSWTVESGDITIDTTNPVVTFTMPSSNVIIKANYEEETEYYTINYNTNGGTGAMTAQTVEAGQPVTLSTNTFTYEGKTFKGWSTSSSATTATYTEGQSITPTSDMTLYAIWEEEITGYTLTYDANNGSGAPESQTGTTLTISITTPTRSGYIFVGWGTSSSATSTTYTAGDSITLTADTTLYAVWKGTITLTYNANSGSGAPESENYLGLETSHTFTISDVEPTRSNYIFLGWGTSSSATSATYTAGDSITISSSTTLYAVWKGTIYLTYDANGGSGAPSSESYLGLGSYTFTISSIEPTNEIATFLGWVNGSIGPSAKYAASAEYTGGDSITISSSTTLYAVYQCNCCGEIYSRCICSDWCDTCNKCISHCKCESTVETPTLTGYIWSSSSTDLEKSDISKIHIVKDYGRDSYDNWYLGYTYVNTIRAYVKRCYIDNQYVYELIISAEGANKIYASSCGSLFMDFTNVTSISGLDRLDTSNVTTMSQMFRECNSLTSLDVSNFNTSNVTNMFTMFYNCNSLTSLDVSNFNTSNVTNMGSMFGGCGNVTSLDVSNFNTSAVTDMSGMFGGCSVTSLDVSNFNTSNVTDMSGMFSGCSGLTSLNVSSFDTSLVTHMGSMFAGCSGLTSLNLSNFNTSAVTNMNRMFDNCESLTSLDVSNFNTSLVTNMYGMFNDCTDLINLDLSSFNTVKVTDMRNMFCRCESLENLNLSKFNTSALTETNRNNMFYLSDNLKQITLGPKFKFGSITNGLASRWYLSDGTQVSISGNQVNATTITTYYAVNPTL